MTRRSTPAVPAALASPASPSRPRPGAWPTSRPTSPSRSRCAKVPEIQAEQAAAVPDQRQGQGQGRVEVEAGDAPPRPPCPAPADFRAAVAAYDQDAQVGR